MWEGVDEVEEEEEEEHTEDGMNDKLVNPAANDGARRNGRCGHHRAAALATIAASAVWSGHVVSAESVQAIAARTSDQTRLRISNCGARPTTSSTLWTPPLSSLLSLLTMSSYRMIRYSIHEEKYSKYDYFAYIRRNSIVQKNRTQ